MPDLQVEAPRSVESPAETMQEPTACKLGLVCDSSGDLGLMASELQERPSLDFCHVKLHMLPNTSHPAPCHASLFPAFAIITAPPIPRCGAFQLLGPSVEKVHYQLMDGESNVVNCERGMCLSTVSCTCQKSLLALHAETQTRCSSLVQALVFAARHLPST